MINTSDASDISDILEINGNKISMSEMTKSIRSYLESKGLVVYFTWGSPNDLNVINQVVRVACENPNKRYIVFFTNDYNDDLDLPPNVILYRTGLYNSRRKVNEYVLPTYYTAEPKYSLKEALPPIEKTVKPKVCFAGCPWTYPDRIRWLEYIRNSELLECKFHYTEGFRGGNIERLIDNFATSEFCFCPRGNGNFSIRFYETLHYGRIPVLLRTDTLLPFSKFINWDEIVVSSDKLEDLPQKIVDFWKNNDIVAIQRKTREISKEFFSLENLGKYFYDEITS
jgi:hypothetical protein